MAIEQTEFIKGLQLHDTGQQSTESETDILIGSNRYWEAIFGEIKLDRHRHSYGCYQFNNWIMS